VETVGLIGEAVECGNPMASVACCSFSLKVVQIFNDQQTQNIQYSEDLMLRLVNSSPFPTARRVCLEGSMNQEKESRSSISGDRQGAQ
jgi:hypothetical protein